MSLPSLSSRKKIPFPLFAFSRSSFAEFIHKFETYIAQYGLPITDQYKLQWLPLHLEETERQIFERQLTLAQKDTFQKAVQNLLKYFDGDIHKRIAEHALQKCKQEVYESAYQFATRIEIHCNELTKDLPQRARDLRMCNEFIARLQPQLSKLTAARYPQSFEQAKEIAFGYETLLIRHREVFTFSSRGAHIECAKAFTKFKKMICEQTEKLRNQQKLLEELQPLSPISIQGEPSHLLANWHDWAKWQDEYIIAGTQQRAPSTENASHFAAMHEKQHRKRARDFRLENWPLFCVKQSLETAHQKGQKHELKQTLAELNEPTWDRDWLENHARNLEIELQRAKRFKQG